MFLQIVTVFIVLAAVIGIHPQLRSLFLDLTTWVFWGGKDMEAVRAKTYRKRSFLERWKMKRISRKKKPDGWDRMAVAMDEAERKEEVKRNGDRERERKKMAFDKHKGCRDI